MATRDEVLTWAREIAASLKLDMVWEASSDYSVNGGYWVADDHEASSRIQARATAALDFFDRFAGGTRWSSEAQEIYKHNNASMETGARGIGDLLIEWSSQVAAGRIQAARVDAMNARVVASTDLMEQVRTLNDDKSISPAAPVVLAGAALEIALRSAVEDLALPVAGRPGIDSYAKALRSADVIDKQGKKDVDQIAGLRNQAAHGEHETLDHQRSGLMEQQVNLFLQRLDTALEAAT